MVTVRDSSNDLAGTPCFLMDFGRSSPIGLRDWI